MKAAFLDFRPAAASALAVTGKAATDLVRLFALDRIPSVRRQLVCHWRRGDDGRLVAVWEPDIVVAPRH